MGWSLGGVLKDTLGSITDAVDNGLHSVQDITNPAFDSLGLKGVRTGLTDIWHDVTPVADLLAKFTPLAPAAYAYDAYNAARDYGDTGNFGDLAKAGVNSYLGAYGMPGTSQVGFMNGATLDGMGNYVTSAPSAISNYTTNLYDNAAGSLNNGLETMKGWLPNVVSGAPQSYTDAQLQNVLDSVASAPQAGTQLAALNNGTMTDAGNQLLNGSQYNPDLGTIASEAPATTDPRWINAKSDADILNSKYSPLTGEKFSTIDPAGTQKYYESLVNKAPVEFDPSSLRSAKLLGLTDQYNPDMVQRIQDKIENYTPTGTVTDARGVVRDAGVLKALTSLGRSALQQPYGALQKAADYTALAAMIKAMTANGGKGNQYTNAMNQRAAVSSAPKFGVSGGHIVKRAEGGSIPGQARNSGALGQVHGQTGGQDDKVPARLSPGEYVMDADVVSALGDGNTEAGARKLDQMRQNIRKHNRSGGLSSIPPKSKDAEHYLKGVK